MSTSTNLVSNFGFVGHSLELSGKIDSSKIPKSKSKERAIHLYSKNWMGREYMGTAPIDHSNCFNFKYTPSSSKITDVSMEIFEKNRPFIAHGLTEYSEFKPLGKVSVKLNNDLKQEITITDAEILALTTIKEPPAQSKPSFEYYVRLFLAVAPEIIKSIFVTVFSHWMTIERVQRIYDSFGRQYPATAPTLPNLANDLLNTICAVDYEQDGDQVQWVANWDGYEFDRAKSLPNVTVKARKVDDSVTIDAIHVKFRESEEKVITEQSPKEELEWAIYMARSAFAVKGESEIHLARTHLLPGIFAHAFNVISKENPLYKVVKPYSKNIEQINLIGGMGVIFGKGSILELSALTAHSVAQVIIKDMKKFANYLNYKPGEPICGQHKRVIIGKLYFSSLLEYYTKYVNDNWNEIARFKKEIFELSETMNKNLSDIPKIMEDPEQLTQEIEGKKLALCLASFVYQTTYGHYSSHAPQEVVTHLDRSSFCILNEGRDTNGKPVKFGNTPVDVGSEQLKLARSLLNFKPKLFVDCAEPDLLAHVRKNQELCRIFPLEKLYVTTEI